MSDTAGMNDTGSAAAHVVCTLAEGHYFFGVAALANSLVASGFKGIIVVGFRGQRPHWLSPFQSASAPDTYELTTDVYLQLVEVPGEWHLNNCKPRFIRQVLFDIHPKSDIVYYFDSDIVIKQSWQVFATWVAGGIVVALDAADTYMPPNHTYRTAWRLLAEKSGYTCREFTGYANGGCVGIARAYAAFATIWSALMEQLESDGADMHKMKNANDMLEFARMDQDILNATMMATDLPISVLGPESMGLFPWIGNIMPHAMWHAKPWRRNYIVDALRGFPPDRVHRAYWDFVDGPIRPYSESTRAFKRLQITIALLIGRIHTRSYRDI